MSDYVSTTDRAALIRAALKAKGWNSRKVSVKSSYYSMGSSIDVTVKDVTIPLNEVKRIAEAHERIDRCEFSGDILSGCNRYVHVRYDWKAVEDAAKPWLPAVEAAVAKVHDNYLIPVEGTPFLVGKRDWALTVWTSGDSGRYIGEASNPKGVAETIVEKLANITV